MNNPETSNFQFKGFTPNSKVKKKSKVFYNLIESRAPSDSKKQVALIKSGKIYEGRLKISSAGSCSFEISSKENNISDSIDSLQKQFFDKILKWNKNRNPKTYRFEK